MLSRLLYHITDLYVVITSLLELEIGRYVSTLKLLFYLPCYCFICYHTFYYDHAIFRHNCRSHLFHCAMPCTAPVLITRKEAYRLMLVVIAACTATFTCFIYRFRMSHIYFVLMLQK